MFDNFPRIVRGLSACISGFISGFYVAIMWLYRGVIMSLSVWKFQEAIGLFARGIGGSLG